MIKAMVDEGWHQKHPEMEFIELEGVDWLTGFYSRIVTHQTGLVQ